MSISIRDIPRKGSNTFQDQVETSFYKVEAATAGRTLTSLGRLWRDVLDSLVAIRASQIMTTCKLTIVATDLSAAQHHTRHLVIHVPPNSAARQVH